MTDRSDLTPDTHVHLVGIGGSGMSALAQVLLERGMPVSGSDLRGGGTCELLQAMGAHVDIGHAAEHVADADVVVISNAVPADNPEVVAARDRGIPVILRADLLELLMGGRRRLLVTGTHGKTTTTAMATVALRSAGLDPSFAIGGALDAGGTSAHHGGGEVFVAEADEAFRSFLRLTPDVAVVTNLEMDHHDEYADLAAYTDAYVQFLGRRPEDAPAILCADDAGSAGLAARVAAPVTTYGTTARARVHITEVAATTEGGSTFRLTEDGADLGAFAVGVPGLHNVRNATAAILAARWLGADPAAAGEGLRSFTGAMRRFQRLGSAAGVAIVDDYGHHPTELVATIDAARQANPDGRVVAVFQPHRYTRTQALGQALGRALVGADLVVVTSIYTAGEAPIPGVTGELVADAARDAGADVTYVPDADGLDRAVAVLVRPGDLLLTIGAGDITALGPRLLHRLGGDAS